MIIIWIYPKILWRRYQGWIVTSDDSYHSIRKILSLTMLRERTQRAWSMFTVPGVEVIDRFCPFLHIFRTIFHTLWLFCRFGGCFCTCWGFSLHIWWLFRIFWVLDPSYPLEILLGTDRKSLLETPEVWCYDKWRKVQKKSDLHTIQNDVFGWVAKSFRIMKLLLDTRGSSYWRE